MSPADSLAYEGVTGHSPDLCRVIRHYLPVISIFVKSDTDWLLRSP